MCSKIMKVVFICENDLSEQTCKNRKLLFATEIIFSNNPKCTLLTDLLRYTITVLKHSVLYCILQHNVCSPMTHIAPNGKRLINN